MDFEPYKSFAKSRLGFDFNDISLLVTALTHRSYVNEHKSATAHNERLEFLGDAILELVSSDFLYKNYNETEGIMTSWRAALVRTESICEAGKELGYVPLIRLSKGETTHGTDRAHDIIIADCFEAVIGAVYLDQGYEEAKKLIEKYILTKIDTIIEEGSWRAPKSYFQELAQKHEGTTPTYRTIREEGPDHDKTFTIGVYVNNVARGIGSGHSKQEAEQSAAKEGIKYYKNLEKSSQKA